MAHFCGRNTPDCVSSRLDSADPPGANISLLPSVFPLPVVLYSPAPLSVVLFSLTVSAVYFFRLFPFLIKEQNHPRRPRVPTQTTVPAALICHPFLPSGNERMFSSSATYFAVFLFGCFFSLFPFFFIFFSPSRWRNSVQISSLSRSLLQAGSFGNLNSYRFLFIVIGVRVCSFKRRFPP